LSAGPAFSPRPIVPAKASNASSSTEALSQ
jgi:hypothetical protein